MLDADFQRLLTSLQSLASAQLAALDEAVRERIASSRQVPRSAPPMPATEQAVAGPQPAAPAAGQTIAAIEARFLGAPRCPHCQSASILKWGSANGLKRYRCKACKVTFNALTGTPLAQLHKRELWEQHAGALLDGISLRKV